MTQQLMGKLFGDEGYVSQMLFEKLYQHRNDANSLANLLCGLIAYLHHSSNLR